MSTLTKNWKLIILLCISLGLAPFTPEPHIVGKLRWIIGGAKDMELMDWFDTLLHSFPFILLILLIVQKIIKK